MFTPRNLLWLVSQFYDPLGLLSPLTIKLKILLKRTVALKIPLDSPIPNSARTEWCTILREFITSEDIIFPRSTKPEGTQGNPWLIGFWDGADPAFCCTIYLRWEMQEGPPQVRLMAARVRVT